MLNTYETHQAKQRRFLKRLIRARNPELYELALTLSLRHLIQLAKVLKANNR